DAAITLTSMEAWPVRPSLVVAVATMTVVWGAISASAVNVVPSRQPGNPLTVTPRSSPAPSTVPRTSTVPAGMIAPDAGSRILTLKPTPPTVNASVAGEGSSFPARSRAFASISCRPAGSAASVVTVARENADQPELSTRQANSSSGAGV